MFYYLEKQLHYVSIQYIGVFGSNSSKIAIWCKCTYTVEYMTVTVLNLAWNSTPLNNILTLVFKIFYHHVNNEAYS
jgi:hypothetical protein